jgi:hypothetical protein
VEGPGCEFKERRGFLSKTAKVRRGLTGGDGSGHWIAIQRRRLLAGAAERVDRVVSGQADPGRWMAIGWWRTVGGESTAAVQRRRAAARRGLGAGVHHLLHGSRRDDERARAKSKASSRGGGVDG